MVVSYEVALAEVNSALPIRKIAEGLDRLALSADAKALLMDLARITTKVGNAVIAIGRKIMSIVLDVVRSFPRTTFGLIIAVTITMFITMIPLLGAAIAGVVGPILAAFGVGVGAIQDAMDRDFGIHIRNVIDGFASLAQA